MLGNIFSIFSRRQGENVSTSVPLSPAFRNRFKMLMRDSLQGALSDFLLEMNRKLSYLHGVSILSGPQGRHLSPQDDVLRFLATCSDAHFLDVIEYMFQLDTSRYLMPSEDLVIDQLNEFLRVDELPYYVTKSVWVETETSFHGTPFQGRRLTEHPRVIRNDCELLHNTSVEPALALLRHDDMRSANEEFLEALADYRKGDFRDCVTKCCSSVESVMKVICQRNRYAYDERDTAATLLKAILAHTNLESFWEQPILIIATIRNRLGSAHGAGTIEKAVSEHVARYSINATASAILFLVDEAY